MTKKKIMNNDVDFVSASSIFENKVENAKIKHKSATVKNHKITCGIYHETYY